MRGEESDCPHGEKLNEFGQCVKSGCSSNEWSNQGTCEALETNCDD